MKQQHRHHQEKHANKRRSLDATVQRLDVAGVLHDSFDLAVFATLRAAVPREEPPFAGAEGMLHFHNKQVVPQVFSETVKEEDEGTPLVDLVINRVEELDSNLLIRLVEQGRVLLNGKPAEAETQLKAGHQIELDVPATELLRRRVEQEIERGGLESGNISLLIQADKDVRHETIINLCAMAGELGVGRVLLATRPTDFSRPPEPEN